MAVEINSSCRLAAPALVAAALFLAGAAAAAAGINSCEKIKDADAYNACLASFGPSIGAHKITATPPAADEAPKEAEKAARRRGRRPGEQAQERHAQERHVQGNYVQESHAHAPKRQANGRVRIEIMPGQ